MADPIMPFSELAGYKAGQDTGDFLKNAAVVAKDFYCDLYGKYPQYFNGIIPVQPFSDFNKGINDNLCRNNPKPQPNNDNLPGQGGQCVGIRYNVQGRLQGILPDGSPAATTLTTLASNQPGPISARVRRTPAAAGGGQASYNIDFFSAGNPTAFTTLASPNNWIALTNSYWRAIRVDGQPDTCGDGPNLPLIKPQPNDLVKPVPVPNPNGNPVILPVFLPIVNVFRPNIQVGVGPVNINIAPGGVTISPRFDLPDVTINNPEVNFPVSLPPGTPTTRPPVSKTEECPCDPVDLKPIKDALDLIKKYTRRPKTDFQVQSLGAGDSGSYTLPPKTRFVTVDVTVTPGNKRQQDGGSAGPDVYHQGWCAVGRNGKYGERVPLSYGANCYPVPVGCDSFSFTMYSGGAAAVSAVVEKDLTECQTYECG